MTRSGIVRISGAVLVALGATAMFAVSTASANGGGNGHDKPPPPSGDDRAVSHTGNVTTCGQIGLKGLQTINGETLVAQGLAFLDNGKVNITVVAAPAGKTYRTIVVKGGNGYNVYEPGKRGLSVNPPYSELHSPINGSGHPAGISHWFACVGKDHGPTTTPPTETTAPPTETTAPPTETTAPPTETTAPPTETTAPPTETTAPPTETTAPPTETTAPPTETTAPPTETTAPPTETTAPPTEGPSETPSEGPSETPTEAPTSVAPVNNGNNGKTGGLANTGFNTGFSLTLAGILLLVGLMMVLAPGRLAVAVGRLRRRG